MNSIEKSFEDGLNAVRATSDPLVANLNAVRDRAGAVSDRAQSLVASIDAINSAATPSQTEHDPLALLSMTLEATQGLQRSVSALETIKLGHLVDMLGRQTQTNRMISTCLQVEVTKISAQDAGLGEFSEALSAFSKRFLVLVLKAKKSVAAIFRNIEKSRLQLNGEVARQRQQIGVVEALVASQKTGHDLHQEVTQTLQARVENLLDATHSAICDLLRSLQFLDAFTQRLDNARKIVGQASDMSPEIRGQAHALVIAQLGQLLTDTRDIRARSKRALKDIQDASQTAQTDLAGGSGFNAQLNTWIESQSKVTVSIERCAADSRVALEAVFSMIDALDRESEVMATELGHFADLAQDFRIVGMNGAIAAARQNASTNAMSSSGFLAKEAGTLAREATNILEECSGIVHGLRTRISHLDKQTLGDIVAKVSAYSDATANSIAEFRESKMAVNDGLAQLGAALKDLLRACEDARSVDSQYVKMEALLENVVALMDSPGVSLKQTDALEWVWACYTTEDERRLHAALIGPRTDDANVQLDDELDDFLL
ncbi:hypothetical protein [Aestuariivita boseongensis]|uniref:hypothetical protein n=1 Tax=Aestuariivita boseongensis TaxID=1470562 RepID=UPI000681F786|nr:hypothetical protein [Aestuariivita boseongensis]